MPSGLCGPWNRVLVRRRKNRRQCDQVRELEIGSCNSLDADAIRRRASDAEKVRENACGMIAWIDLVVHFFDHAVLVN